MGAEGHAKFGWKKTENWEKRKKKTYTTKQTQKQQQPTLRVFLNPGGTIC